MAHEPCESELRSPVMTLKTRQLEPELMDDPEIETGDHDRALEGLARLNRLARAAARARARVGRRRALLRQR